MTCLRCAERDFDCRYSDASKAGKPKGSRNRKTLGRLRHLEDRERELGLLSRASRRSLSALATPTSSLGPWDILDWDDKKDPQDFWKMNWTGTLNADINEILGHSSGNIEDKNDDLADLMKVDKHVRLPSLLPSTA